MTRSRLEAWALCVILVGSLLAQCQRVTPPVYLNDASVDSLRVGNDHYEIALSKSNGGIDYVIDKATGEHVTEGNLDGCLWAVVYNYGPPAESIDSCRYRPTGQDRFSYAWTAPDNRLTLTYLPDPSAAEQVTATVTLTVSEETWFDLQIRLENRGGRRSDGISFPANLVFARDEISQALLPILPGVVLEPGFFDRGVRYAVSYPGWPGVFADLAALSSTRGSFAMYTAGGADRLVPALLGYDFGDETSMIHDFKSQVPDGGRWTSPRVRVCISESWHDTLERFRVESGIGATPALRNKLGDRYEVVVQSPLFKADTTALGIRFTEYQPLLARIPTPGLLHVIGFEPLDVDEGFPDFLPPDPKYGTTPEMADMFSQAQAAGFVVMPYINPTWWEVGSPTLRHLEPSLAISDIAALDELGNPYLETYGGPDYHHGYVMSPHAIFVQDRVDQLLRQMTQELPSDLIYADQIGARPTMFDYNPASPSADAYSQGWVELTRRQAGARLTTECGFDRLVETMAGFFGSVRLLERRGETLDWWGADTWRYYPLATMLARDKVLFSQFNLAPESFTQDASTLALNVAMGYMLGYDLCPSEWGGGMEDEWMALVASFQRYVLAQYAGERVTGYVELAPGVTRTRFETFGVITNWVPDRSYTAGAYVLPASGFLIEADNDSLIAGLFTTYNRVPLSDGDHYLIEERHPDEIIVRQPKGGDTSLTLRSLSGWDAKALLEVLAYASDGRPIGLVPVTLSEGGVTFVYRQEVNGQPAAMYRIVRSCEGP